MTCPICNNPGLQLSHSRDERTYTFRSYVCHNCHLLTHTHEYVQGTRRVPSLVAACAELQRVKDTLRKTAHKLEQLQFDLHELAK